MEHQVNEDSDMNVKIVSDDFRKALPRLIACAEKWDENTTGFEYETGIKATSHVKHLGNKLMEALNEIERLSDERS